MNCPKCGYNAENFKFCPECGAKILPDLGETENTNKNSIKKSKSSLAKKIIISAIVVILVIAIVVGVIFGIKKNKPIEAGQTITFGSFEQDDVKSNGPEPLEWIVLSVENTDEQAKKALLLSKNAVFSMKYNDENQYERYWVTSDIREWISSSFYQSAFSKDEKSRIILTETTSETEDYVFLLSEEEFKSYIENNVNIDNGSVKHCDCTVYGANSGGYIERDATWWLRDTDNSSKQCKYSVENGGIDNKTLYFNVFGVRPAMWITITE